MDNSNTERAGVHMVGYIVQSELKWILREQTVLDYGIDAEIEVQRNGCPAGRLIAVQIKSGESYFKGGNPEQVALPLKERHVNYWLNHSLPVIIVLFNQENKTCIWEHFSSPNIFYTKSQKPYYFIRRSHFLNKKSGERLDDLVDAGSVVSNYSYIV